MTIADKTDKWQEAREQTLPRGEPARAIENAWSLKEIGLAHIRQLAGKIWTDHNIHDPGIAILDLLCFAVSDLGFRTNYDLEDLLEEVPETEGASPPPPQFFTAREILTSAPVTSLDYRKLMIDTDGIKNAWIKPAKHQEIPLFFDREADALDYVPPTLGGLNTGQDQDILMRGLNTVFLELSRQVEIKEDLNDNFLNVDLTLAIGSGAERTDYPLELVIGFGGLFDPHELNQAHPERYNLQPDNPDHQTDYIVYQADWSPAHMDALFRNSDSFKVTTIRPAFAWLDKDVMVPLMLEFTKGAETTLAGLCLHFSHAGRLNLGAKAVREALVAMLRTLRETWLKGLILRHQRKLIRRSEIVEATIARLHANRALCEDYANIFGMKVEQIGLCIDIELDPSADAEQVYSDIRFQVEQFLSPDIQFRTLEHLLDEGVDPTEIFEGPALRHGFIDPASLMKDAWPDEINSSDIINILMDIDGIVTVRDLMMSSYVDGAVRNHSQRWSLELINDERHVPRLSLNRSKLNFFKGYVPCAVDLAEADLLYEEALAKRERNRLAADVYDIEPPEGTFRALDGYTSIQTHFPLNFGIGHEGLAASESDERKAQAAQLKAFLMFFDQMLANYLAQLNEVKNILSINGNTEASYFVGPVYGAPNIAPLIRDFMESDGASIDPADTEAVADAWKAYVATDPNTGYRDRLIAISDTEPRYLKRQNRLLDHLLARFSEQFADYALLLYSLEGRRRADKDLIEDKRTFLKEYPAISSGRSLGFNYFDPLLHWKPDNVSGLAHRTSRLVGIPPRGDRALAPDAGPEVVFTKDGNAWVFELTVPTGDTTPPLVVKSEADATRNPTKKAAQRTFYDLIRIITEDVYAYFPPRADGTHILYFLNREGDRLATCTEVFTSEADARAALDVIFAFIDETYFLEGMHVVEHILLRPLTKNAGLLGTSSGQDCSLPSEIADPYSYRATVVLPALAERFRNRDMRALVENTLRLEAPAHVSLKICWIDHNQMRDVEAAMKAWAAAKIGVAPDLDTLTEKQNTLLTVLKGLTSIYPVATLHDCDDPDDNLNPVVLDHTAIGTFTENTTGTDSDGD